MKAIILVALLCFSARVVMSRTESGCPASYFLRNNNECVACPANCKTCSSGLIKDCSECSTGFSKWLGDDFGCMTNTVQCKAFCEIDSTIICNGCSDGYYALQNVNKTAIGICDGCAGKIANCKTCTDDKTCTTCVAAFFFDATAKTCKACSDGCAVCTDAATCTTCKAGYAKSSTNTCKACGADCAECNAEKTSECSKCNAGAFLNASTKVCLVIAGCEEGADGKCTKCLDGFRLKSDGTCIACSGSNVWLCNSTSDTAESIIACKVGFVKTIAGTTTTTVACKSKISACSEQNSDDKCTKCQAAEGTTSWVLHNGACVVCSTQFTGCATCTDGSITTEAKCAACNTVGYYNSGSATAVSCSSCPGNCQTCTATGCSACVPNAVNTATAPAVSCTICDANATGCTDTLNVSGCKAQYVSGSVDICRACKDAQCTTCATYDTCTACTAGHSVQSGACVKCDVNCKNNTPSCATNGKDKCDADNQCDNTNAFYLTLAATDSAKANTCQKCDANCTGGCAGRGGACSDNGCKEGFGPHATTKVCTACSNTGCKTCNADHTTCSACMNGYGYDNAQAAPNKCKACTAADCAECAYATPATCTKCIAGSGKATTAAAVNGLISCTNGDVTDCITYKTDGTVRDDCIVCKAGKNAVAKAAGPPAVASTCTTACGKTNCATCDTVGTPATCTTCNSGYTKAADGNCWKCHASCQKDQCSGATADGVCDAAKCLEGFGKRGVAIANGGHLCAACPANCATCEAATICDTCLPNKGFFLKYDKTDCNVPGVANCLTTVNGDNATAGTGYDQCQACKVGFFPSADKKTCTACSSNCLACTSATVCTDCGTNLGFVKLTDACSACGSNCATCTVAGGCDSCKAGFLYDATAKACNACASNCTGCTVKDTCDGGSCTGAWGKTSGITKKQTLCFACPTNCATCTVDNKQVTTCTKCLNGFYLDASKTCIAQNNKDCQRADGTSCTRCFYGQTLKAANAGCVDCITDRSCPKTCGGSVVVGPVGTGNVTTTTTDDSSNILVFNAIILTILGFIAHLLI